MIIKFHQLSLKNYKSHRNLEVKFGDLTKITGDNAKGKSSILEAIPFILYGTDALGSKTDPTPTNYEFDITRADLLLSIDGKQVLLSRGIEKAKATYYINEVPKKATEFDELVKSLFEKDIFLSLFNPSYFFTLKWDEQRSLLLRYVSSPANKEVFKHMIPLQADKLQELVKKHSLDDLQKIHSKRKTDLEKEYIRAQERVKTLNEQLAKIPTDDVDAEALEKERENLKTAIDALNDNLREANEHNQKRAAVQAKIDLLQGQIKVSSNKWPELRDEEIIDICKTCHQQLTDDALEAVKSDKERRMKLFKENHEFLVSQRKVLQDELLELEIIDVTEIQEQLSKMRSRVFDIVDEITLHSKRSSLEQEIESSRIYESQTLSDKNESIFILDAVKAFHAKEAELMAAKVQDLFTSLSLRLFKQNKGDGEIKPDFEVEMDGKPYRKLSLSEGIRAGLELRDVLSQQSQVLVPCCIDNSESITKFTKPHGQLIICKVVPDQELKIESEDK